MSDGVEQTLAGLGQHLRQSRELKGLEIYDVANELKLLESQVREMENGEYVHINNLVFAKGYVRNYAQFLGMDVNQVVDWFERATLSQQRDNPVPRSRARQWPPAIGLAVIIGIGLVLGLGIWFTWRALSDSGSPATNPASPALVTAPLREEQAAAREIPAAPAMVAPGALDTTPDEPTVPESVEQVTAQPELLMRFSADCWVEVRDADGKRLLADLKRSGDEVRLTGKEPLEVLIGYVPAVEVSYGGESVPILPGDGRQSAKVKVGLENAE